MSYSNFFDQEFLNVDLRDKRLIKRTISIGNNLIRSPGSCIQEVFVTKNDARCAYDFFSNPKVKWLNLLGSHQAQTVERINNCQDKHIYVIQDSTFYNYTVDQNNKWLLLTNLPVRTLEDAIFVVQSYKRRWHIESLHKVLKTALQILKKAYFKAIYHLLMLF